MKDFNATKIKDNTERIWFLGTDLLEDTENDLFILDRGLGVSYHHVGHYASIIHVREEIDELVTEFDGYSYSEKMIAIICEAHRRGYKWIAFDRDIETEEITKYKGYNTVGYEGRGFFAVCNECAASDLKTEQDMGLSKDGEVLEFETDSRTCGSCDRGLEPAI